jgi:hypothetical protein
MAPWVLVPGAVKKSLKHAKKNFAFTIILNENACYNIENGRLIGRL